MHKLVITPSAKRSLKKLPIKIREELIKAVKILETDIYAGEKLSGSLHFLYSLHFKYNNTEYRAVYSIDSKNKLVIIHFAGSRENFYEKIKRLFR